MGHSGPVLQPANMILYQPSPQSSSLQNHLPSLTLSLSALPLAFSLHCCFRRAMASNIVVLTGDPQNVTTSTTITAAMQSNVDDLNDDLQNVSFESTTTTSTSTNTTTPTATWATSSLASSSMRPHAPLGDPRWDAIRRVRSVAATLEFDDLVFLRRLGSGDIGRVYQVELKCAGGCFFAAKVMDKEELASRSKEGRARIEREILELLDHPFLPTLYATVDSPKLFCLLTEFCPGGDLHILRQRQPNKRFNQEAVRQVPYLSTISLLFGTLELF